MYPLQLHFLSPKCHPTNSSSWRRLNSAHGVTWSPVEGHGVLERRWGRPRRLPVNLPSGEWIRWIIERTILTVSHPHVFCFLRIVMFCLSLWVFFNSSELSVFIQSWPLSVPSIRLNFDRCRKKFQVLLLNGQNWSHVRAYSRTYTTTKVIFYHKSKSNK